jgi:NADPH2:quinone reductase
MAMTRAIVIHKTGDPGQMQWEQVPLPELLSGQVRVRHTAIGFNMIDTYRRKGLYPIPLPFVPGSEAAGVVEQIAEGVDTLKVGDRVVYAVPEVGAYTEQRVIAANKLIKIPADISDETAAAGFLKGLTVWALLHKTYAVQPGHTILIYAAAGGVGTLLGQWAKHLSARVIGVVGAEDKVAVALHHGCDEVINYSNTDIAASVRQLTAGKGVEVVYDSMGAATFSASLDCLKPLGMMVSFGNATGPVPPVDILDLMRRGSLFLTRPTLFNYIASRGQLEQGAAALFDVIRTGAVKVMINQRFELKDAVRAHIAVESRQTTGATVLINR